MYSDKNLSVQVLILDADRNPIKGQRYKLHFNGRVVAAETGEDGLTKKISTRSPNDEVQIAVERLDKSFETVARIISGAGNKLVTLVSQKVKLTSSALPHPATTPGQIPNKREAASPFHNPKEKKVPTAKTEFGQITEQMKNEKGDPVTKVEGDIPNLEFLANYNGEVMSDDDYRWAAKELDIELAAIKAFAIVESAGSGFFKVGNDMVPKILYERHKFAQFTDNAYSKLNPDISLPAGYYNAKNRYVLADESYKKERKVPRNIEFYRAVRKKDDEKTKEQSETFKGLIEQGKLERGPHMYVDGVGSYKRLIKAYKLDPEAALKSCSWGSFQIMGEFWSVMGFASVVEFSKSMSRSPKDQVKAFVLYIKRVNPEIKTHLRHRDWRAAARAYNGPDYEAYKYHIKLEAAYEKFKKEEV